MKKVRLCQLSDLADHQTKGIQVALPDGELDVIVLRQKKQIHAYLNHCPHLGVPLNWQPDVFLSPEETHFQCSTHGALFTLEEGYCIVGPCSGQSLVKLNTEIDSQGAVYLISEQ
ncbi:MAG: Rieske (2Fe-2S) protein [Methylophaga sp.]|nr:Rieske (2Fe-2S) protein [Methylophaga sp.]